MLSLPMCMRYHDSIASCHFIDMVWASWHLKSLATRLHVHQLVHVIDKENTKALFYRSVMREVHLWPMDTPQKRPDMWKAIPRHDVTMAIPCWSLRSHFYRSNIWPLPARHRGGTDSIYRHSHSAHGHSLLTSRHPKTIFASERFRRSRHIAIIQAQNFRFTTYRILPEV